MTKVIVLDDKPAPSPTLESEIKALHKLKCKLEFSRFNAIYITVTIHPPTKPRDAKKEGDAVLHGKSPSRPISRRFHIVYDFGKIPIWLQEMRATFLHLSD